MRSKKGLKELEEINLLMKWLYMGNKVTYFNGIVDLTVAIDDHFNMSIVNNNFPQMEPMKEEIEVRRLFDMVYVLKETPPHEFKERFSSEWELIKTMCKATLTLNR